MNATQLYEDLIDGGDLSSYAAAAAIEELKRSWDDARNLPPADKREDIRHVIEHLARIAAQLTE